MVTLYSDLTTLECFALNELLATHAAGARMSWRGVQHDPSVPAAARALARREIEQVEDELADLRRQWAPFHATVPRIKPSSAPGILAVASVSRRHAAKAIAFRNAVYRAYWHDGLDISSMAVLQRLADVCDVPRQVDLRDPAAEDDVEEWETSFAVDHLGGVPRAIRGDGKILWGFRGEQEAREFFDGA